MTTSNLQITTSTQSRGKRVGAAIALAMFTSLVGLSSITSSAQAYGYSEPNFFGGYDYHFDDGSSYSSQPNFFGGYDYY